MFFNKKEMNAQAAEQFWKWYLENETWIIQGSNSGDMTKIEEVIQAIDARLTPVFPYEPNNNIQFQLGAHQGNNEFFFFTLGKKALMRDGEILGRMMPEKLKADWTYILEE